jgi:hypothetical protein
MILVRDLSPCEMGMKNKCLLEVFMGIAAGKKIRRGDRMGIGELFPNGEFRVAIPMSA